MPLAELNIAMPKYPLDDPRIAGFTDNIQRVNDLAATMPGFVWRHVDEAPGHPGHRPVPWPNAIVTLSVWERAEDLHHFVRNTIHKAFYERRAEWFDAMDAHHFVMWHIAPDHRPTLAEAKARLDHLDTHGDTDHAFGWSHLAPIAHRNSQQCG